MGVFDVVRDLIQYKKREHIKTKQKNNSHFNKIFFFFESFALSFSDLNNAIEMYANIQSDETKDALESSLDGDVIMNYSISTHWIFVIDKDSMGSITPEQLIDAIQLFLYDPNFVVTLDISDPSSILFTLTKKYEDYDDLDEIYDLFANILSNNFGFTLIESDENYSFIVDGNIAIVEPTSSAISFLVSESLGIDFKLEEDSVIFFFYLVLFPATHQVGGTVTFSCPRNRQSEAIQKFASSETKYLDVQFYTLCRTTVDTNNILVFIFFLCGWRDSLLPTPQIVTSKDCKEIFFLRKRLSKHL
jgi:hypothetical protein